ncbi:MAG: glycosyltransferase [Deltaproteobacteria bacterium]
MTIHRPSRRVLDGAHVALVFSPGNVSIDYAASLVRGPERALLELGARVDTFTTAHYARDLTHFYAGKPKLGVDQLSDDSSLLRGIYALLDDAPPGGFDLLVGYLYDVMLTPRMCERLRASARRLVNFPWNLLDQEDHFRAALDVFDETWCAEEGALESLQSRHGAKIRYVPMASDPFLFKRLGVPREPRVLFTGSAYGRRGELLSRFAREIDLTVTGRGHDLSSTVRAIARETVRDRRVVSPREAIARLRASVEERAPIGDEAYVALAAEHGISVGFNDVRQESTGKTVYKVRLREYDAAMTGLCHVARRLPELERGFEPGREMLLYDDESEVPEILRRIRRGAVDWRDVGARARARAERDHTWTRRLEDALT